MDSALKVFLLMSLLVSTQTFDNYKSLPHVVQQHIHKAVKEANKIFGAGHHIAYHSLKEPLRVSSVSSLRSCFTCMTNYLYI